jgi:TonB-linked SusC/RagA family outer membrane protein
MQYLMVVCAVLLCYVSGVSTANAQFTVTGTVVSADDNSSLPGVTVVEVGTQRGTVTESDGQFTLTVSNQNASLRFSFIGYRPLVYNLEGESNITVTLQPGVELLDEVVVTAHGLERDRKAVGYSITQITADRLVHGTEANLANLLQGQVSGVTVAPVGGGVGSSTRVTIRGTSSLTDDNQPLYVVDGIPIDNSNIGSAGMWGGFDGGDGIQSLNPEDIESMTVLKGASAAALYGERARDGVILITTKQGSPGQLNVNFSSNTTFDMARVDQFDFQTEYGQGTAGRRPQTQNEARETNISSWGERFDGQQTVQFDGIQRPYNDLGSAMKDFYRTGVDTRNSISVASGMDNATYYFSASHLNNQSIIENSDMNRTSLTARATAGIGKLTADVKANYIDEGTKNRQRVSDIPSNANSMINRMPRNIPLSALRDGVYCTEIGPGCEADDGRERWLTGSPFFTNPYWVINETRNWDQRDRLIGHVKLDFQIRNWLLLTGRTGLDWYTLRRQDVIAWGTAYNLGGSLTDREYRIRESNSDLFLTGVYNLSPSLSVDGMVGSGLRMNQNEEMGAQGNPFIVPGLYSISNMGSHQGHYGFNEKEIRSLYGALNLGYNDYLFLNFTARNDWSSTLPADANSFFYPSVGVSFVFSEALESAMPDWLSFGQLRASWAEVGSDTNPYQLNLTYTPVGTHGGRPLWRIGRSDVPLADLKPTITTEIELGFDIRLLDDRVGLDFAWYERETINQILATNISHTTGYTARVINAGQLDNTGIEFQLTAMPVSSPTFFWRSTLNYGKNTSKVVALVGDQERLTLDESRRQTAWITADVGQEFGTILGYTYLRDSNGNIVHDASGLPMRNSELQILGRGTPDWTAGWLNTISWRNFSLNMMIDVEWGGQIFSGSNAAAYSAGLHKNTLNGRAQCDGNRGDDGRWASDCFVGPGVSENGGTNSVGTTPQAYYGHISTQIAEEFVYDKNVVTMRQIQIGYRLPLDLLSGLGVRSASVSVVGRNLFFLYNPIPNVDPQAGINRGNAQGLEFEGVPHTRSIGFNIDLQF